MHKIYASTQVVLMVKNPPANAGDMRDAGLIPGSRKSSGEENGNPLQYSCLENPTDRGTWQATVHVVGKSQMRLNTHTCALNEEGKLAFQLCEKRIKQPFQDNLRHRWKTVVCMLTTNMASVQFSCSVMSDSLRPHGLQHTRSPCPLPIPRIYSHSCPLTQ